MPVSILGDFIIYGYNGDVQVKYRQRSIRSKFVPLDQVLLFNCLGKVLKQGTGGQAGQGNGRASGDLGSCV